MNNDSLPAEYWDARYLHADTGWDVGYVSTPLKTYIDQLPRKDLAILIPGCGNSYEAEYLLQEGFTNVTVIDISPVLTSSLSSRLAAYIPTSLQIITGDFFALQGQFDLILEQTFFCALLPAQREAYVQQMHALLQPGGKLVGVLFDKAFAGGPPFGGSRAEYEALFATRFALHTLAPCYNSIKPRAGAEVFLIAQKA